MNSAAIPADEPAGAAPASQFTAQDVRSILLGRGWMTEPDPAEQGAWCERAALLLAPQAANLPALEDLLALVFEYNASHILAGLDAHTVMSRYAARDVIRQLALLLLDGAPLTPERFQEIVTTLKGVLDIRGRELFHPLRLALAGRSGEGDLDRVILLLEPAADADFAKPVKNARTRIVEFCAALD